MPRLDFERPRGRSRRGTRGSARRARARARRQRGRALRCGRAEIERRCALGLSDDDAEQLQELAGAVLYGHPCLLDERLARARGSLAVLERLGVRRDLPYLLAERESEALARAGAYWSALGAMERELVREADGMIRLLWPPFELRLADGLTQVELAVKNASGRAAGVVSCRLDGAAAPVEAGAARVRVPCDGARYQLELELD